MKNSLYYTSEKSGYKTKTKKINKISIISGQFLLISFLFTILYFHTGVYAQISTIENNNNNIQIIKDPEKEVPRLVISFGEKEVEMDPFMYSQINFSNNKIKGTQLNESPDNIVTKIEPAKLYETQSDIDTKLTLKHGDKISLSFEKQPLTIKAYLIDYDTEDESEIYPIKQIDFSTFSIPNNSPAGLKSLEIRSFYDNNEQITYTTSVFVESSDLAITTPNIENDNEEENNDN
ncbi:MAG TPA: hypothetical protein VE307_05240 [Nitrososphaeraceae archaeon]|nr:hypothetical protein [Nitrososphaeraceae archaeon]